MVSILIENSPVTMAVCLFTLLLLFSFGFGAGSALGIDSFTLDPLPDKPQYKADGVEYDNGGLGPFYDFSRSFVNSVFPGDFPTDLIKDVTNGNLALGMDMIQDLLKKFVGYVIALGVGILFLVIFPIVGCCFCCCRNCCKACCDRPKAEDSKASCKKKVYGSIFFVLVAFTIAGNAAVYVSNDRISVALDEITKNTGNNLDDFDTYLSFTAKQVATIGTNFDKTDKAIQKELSSTDFAENFADNVIKTLTGGALHDLENGAIAMKTHITTLKSEDANLQTNVNTLTTAGIPISITITMPGDTFPSDFGKTTIEQLKTAISGPMAGLTAHLSNAKSKVSGLSSDVNGVITGIQSAISDAGGFDTKGMKDTVDDMVDTVRPFDDYRRYGGLGIAGIISLIAALQLFGLLFGIFGSGCGIASDPTKKGCSSNSGGRMIVSSIVFIFLFSWLFMLSTTLLFGVGSLLEKFVCQPLKDPEFKVFDDVFGDVIDINSVLKYTPGNEMKVSTILKNCKENKPIYDAMVLDEMQSMPMKFSDLEQNIQKATDQMKKEITDAVKGISPTTSLSGVNLMSQKTQLNTLKSDIDAIDIDDLEQKVNDAKTHIVNVKRLPAAQTPSVSTAIANIEDSLTKMVETLKKMKPVKADISGSVPGVKKQLDDAQAKIQGSDLSKLSDSFVNKIEGIVNTFFNFTKDAVHKNLGKCGPIWNLYNSIVIVSICDYTVDALNGFWFGVGWCIFFFLPSVVFGIKVSNYLRDTGVDEEWGVDNRRQFASNEQGTGQSRTKPSINERLGRQLNKVGHQDI